MSNRMPTTTHAENHAGIHAENHAENHAETTPSEGECQARADAYVAELIGARPQPLTWDAIHPLQGHVHIGCHELVVIATHDATARPTVLTAAGWDAVRHCAADERRTVLASCAITDHGRLVSVLESDDTEWLATTMAMAA